MATARRPALRAWQSKCNRSKIMYVSCRHRVHDNSAKEEVRVTFRGLGVNDCNLSNCGILFKLSKIEEM